MKKKRRKERRKNNKDFVKERAYILQTFYHKNMFKNTLNFKMNSIVKLFDIFEEKNSCPNCLANFFLIIERFLIIWHSDIFVMLLMHFLDSKFKFSTSNRYTALIKNCLRLDWKKVSIIISTWILKNLAPKVFLFESLNLRVSKTLKKLFYVFVLL